MDSYMQDLQNIRDRIDNQMRQMQTPITQNFQFTPIYNTFRIVSNKDEVVREVVIGDTYFLGKDLKEFWIKNTRGDIRSFNLEEIIPKTEKDLLIEKLQKEIEELKGSVSHDTTDTNANTNEPATKEQSENVSVVSTSQTSE